MNKTVQRCIFVVCMLAVPILSVAAPWVLGDTNTFLAAFIGAPFLSLLGVFAAITLASSANLHLRFNDIEDRAGRRILPNARSSVHRSSFWLIMAMLGAIALLIAKPLLPVGEISSSFANGTALLILLFMVLVMLDLSQLAFSIGPDFEMFGSKKGTSTGGADRANESPPD